MCSNKNNSKTVQSNGFKSINYNNYREDCHDIILDGPVRPYFNNIEKYLIDYINKASYVIGCAAWLTSPDIIAALETLVGVKIIVSKEEFLNPRMIKAQKFSYGCIRGGYQSITDLSQTKCICCSPPIQVINCRNYLRTFGTRMRDIPIDGAILTCGIVNHGSRMHHKFLVFLDESFNPLGVWTGSYNFSRNSNNSLENALYVTDPKVIAEYIKEFLAIYLLSENYAWTSSLLQDSRALEPKSQIFSK